ncbi:MAG: hypothetical protein ABFR95_02730 [Actinomycetota bacterium]
MKWNAALMVSYGTPIPGREAKAMETFADALTIFGKLAADGECSEPEVFHHLIGGGMMIVKTETFEMAHEILDLAEVHKLLDTALLTVLNADVEIMITGEKLMSNMTTFTAVGTELTYI